MIKFDLKDRVAIVTGGAQGFGLAITERFIDSGASVVIWDIDEKEIKKAINKIKSNKTINLINYFNKNKKNEIFFLMGADNLINFHKWHKWKQISEKCNILVFDRYGYKKKSLNSKTYKTLKSEKFKFVYFNKVNISSSQLRKI